MARYWSISAVPVSAHPSPLVIKSFYNEISGGHIGSCRCSEEGLCRPSTTPVLLLLVFVHYWNLVPQFWSPSLVGNGYDLSCRVCATFTFKLAVIVDRDMHGTAPRYLSDQLRMESPTCRTQTLLLRHSGSLKFFYYMGHYKNCYVM